MLVTRGTFAAHTMKVVTSPLRSEGAEPELRSEQLPAISEAPNQQPHQSSQRDNFTSLRRPGEGSALVELTRWIARSLAVFAVLSSAVLLLVGATPALTAVIRFAHLQAPRFRAVFSGPALSAVPLIFAGTAYVVLQTVLRPRGLELLKRLMLGSAFLLWGVVQLMPPGTLSSELGNLVIALYVIDLALIIRSDLLKS
jgi:hypothetical protein